MAVSNDVPGLKVEVVVDGKPLEEFVDRDEEDPPKTITKYIEAISGAEFAVKATFTKPFPGHAVVTDIFLDGNYTTGRYARHFRGDENVQLVKGREWSAGNKHFIQNFSFSELIYTESDMHSDDRINKTLEALGEILVDLHYVKITQATKDKGCSALPTSQGNVSEKALKGRSLTHCSTFKDAVECSPLVYSYFKYMDPLRKPFLTFRFRYRSRAALKSLLIIPRTPSPTPLEERNIESLTREEMIQLLGRHRERDPLAHAQQRGKKRERSSSRACIKEEERADASTPAKRNQYSTILNESGVEVVDLT